MIVGGLVGFSIRFCRFGICGFAIEELKFTGKVAGVKEGLKVTHAHTTGIVRDEI